MEAAACCLPPCELQEPIAGGHSAPGLEQERRYLGDWEGWGGQGVCGRWDEEGSSGVWVKAVWLPALMGIPLMPEAAGGRRVCRALGAMLLPGVLVGLEQGEGNGH